MTRQKRRPRAERRKQIAQAVLHIVGTTGITSLTTTNLAREIGVTSGALFRHFKSRDEILGEAVRYATRQIDETFPDETLPAPERIVMLAKNRLQVLRSEPGVAWLLRSEQASLALPVDAVRLLRSRAERTKQYILAAIEDGVAKGSIRGDITPEILLVPIMGTIHAVLGMPGITGKTTAKESSDPDAVLSALVRMIAPEQTT
jgi:AcrR family transcriptional regulator